MKDFFKNKVVTVIILLFTVVLAGVAIFTAIRLYQLRQQPVAPSAPTKPKAAGTTPQTCTALTFTVSAATSSPTASPTATATATPTATATATATPTSAPTSTPGATSTAEPSLPASGTSWPTLVGFGAGALIILVSAAALLF